MAFGVKELENGALLKRGWGHPKPMLLATSFMACILTSGGAHSTPSVSTKPNVLIILADDLGFSDVGAFGSEIRTPSLDALATEGKILSSFYSGAYCSPSRAMLMSGRNSHAAGIGLMSEISLGMIRSGSQPFKDGFDPEQLPANYQGFLSLDLTSLPEYFQQQGYNTLQAGKWHLSSKLSASPTDKSRPAIQYPPETLPTNRGFNQSFALINGAASHFPPIPGKENLYDRALYADGTTLIKPHELPEDFYSTAYFTDKILTYIEETKDSGQPFFAYLAYTAPHWPLQVPDEDLELYRGTYDVGYEAIREARLENQKNLGLFGQDLNPHPGLDSVADGGTGKKRWDELTSAEQRDQARRMEIYAAMVTNMDRHIGRIVNYLKDEGLYDNTVLIFLSDNGPDPGRSRPDPNTDNSLENMGRVRSTISYGERWAEVSATPFRLWKGYAGAEGSVSVPAIIRIPGGTIGKVHNPVHITDLYPWLVGIVGNPSSIETEGYAWDREFNNPSDTRVIVHDLNGHGYVRQGKWKLMRTYTPGAVPAEHTPEDWQLYDMELDRAETLDIAAQHPAKVQELLAYWNEFLQTNNVIDQGGVLDIPRDPAAP